MVRISPIARKYYPELIWSVETDEKVLFLTFDDGPTPHVTDWVLDQLKNYDAKATFFCLGKNVRDQPAIYQRILDRGHAVGNHTFDHAKGWFTPTFAYLKSVLRCEKYVDSTLFRPPYGRIRKSQIRALLDRFRIVMWDVLSEDYNQSASPESCLKKVISQSKSGSIIVFHDSKKAQKNLSQVLPSVLDHFSSQGYVFRALSI